MQLLIDLHCHSRFSADGVAEPEAMVRRRGKRACTASPSPTTTPAPASSISCSTAHEQGGPPVDGLLIIPGQEITTAEGHLLALGITPAGQPQGHPAHEAVTAHPPGRRPGDSAASLRLFPRRHPRAGAAKRWTIDALEVFNAATTLKRYNKHAFNYAQERGLPMTAASDAHDQRRARHGLQHPRGGRVFRAGRARRHPQGPRAAPALSHAQRRLKKTWNNVFRLRRKRKIASIETVSSEP